MDLEDAERVPSAAVHLVEMPGRGKGSDAVRAELVSYHLRSRLGYVCPVKQVDFVPLRCW